MESDWFLHEDRIDKTMSSREARTTVDFGPSAYTLVETLTSEEENVSDTTSGIQRSRMSLRAALYSTGLIEVRTTFKCVEIVLLLAHRRYQRPRD